jgi:hypothetical protein
MSHSELEFGPEAHWRISPRYLRIAKARGRAVRDHYGIDCLDGSAE